MVKHASSITFLPKIRMVCINAGFNCALNRAFYRRTVRRSTEGQEEEGSGRARTLTDEEFKALLDAAS